MKIISKHKDYYDYLQGVYGMDEKMVYDRRTPNLEKCGTYVSDGINQPTVSEIKFSICNQIYLVYRFEGKSYHTVDELIELHHILKKKEIDESWLHRYYWYDKKTDLRKLAEEKFKEENVKSRVNKEIRQPVLIQHHAEGFEFCDVYDNKNGWQDSNKKVHSYWRIPDLSTYGFAKWYPADEMYQMICAFMGWMVDHPEIPNNQTNKEKIISRGFDTKISFRHRKNKDK